MVMRAWMMNERDEERVGLCAIRDDVRDGAADALDATQSIYTA
jgi:hypothetical protein